MEVVVIPEAAFSLLADWLTVGKVSGTPTRLFQELVCNIKSNNDIIGEVLSPR
jgi:hypothetical protein